MKIKILFGVHLLVLAVALFMLSVKMESHLGVKECVGSNCVHCFVPNAQRNREPWGFIKSEIPVLAVGFMPACKTRQCKQLLPLIDESSRTFKIQTSPEALQFAGALGLSMRQIGQPTTEHQQTKYRVVFTGRSDSNVHILYEKEENIITMMGLGIVLYLITAFTIIKSYIQAQNNKECSGLQIPVTIVKIILVNLLSVTVRLNTFNDFDPQIANNTLGLVFNLMLYVSLIAVVETRTFLVFMYAVIVVCVNTLWQIGVFQQETKCLNVLMICTIIALLSLGAKKSRHFSQAIRSISGLMLVLCALSDLAIARKGGLLLYFLKLWIVSTCLCIISPSNPTVHEGQQYNSEQGDGQEMIEVVEETFYSHHQNSPPTEVLET